MSRKDELDAALWTVMGNDPDPPSVKLGRYWDQMPQWTRFVMAAQVLHDSTLIKRGTVSCVIYAQAHWAM